MKQLQATIEAYKVHWRAVCGFSRLVPCLLLGWDFLWLGFDERLHQERDVFQQTGCRLVQSINIAKAVSLQPLDLLMDLLRGIWEVIHASFKRRYTP